MVKADAVAFWLPDEPCSMYALVPVPMRQLVGDDQKKDISTGKHANTHDMGQEKRSSASRQWYNEYVGIACNWDYYPQGVFGVQCASGGQAPNSIRPGRWRLTPWRCRASQWQTMFVTQALQKPFQKPFQSEPTGSAAAPASLTPSERFLFKLFQQP